MDRNDCLRGRQSVTRCGTLQYQIYMLDGFKTNHGFQRPDSECPASQSRHTVDRVHSRTTVNNPSPNEFRPSPKRTQSTSTSDHSRGTKGERTKHSAQAYVLRQATLSPDMLATPSFFNYPISPGVVPRNTACGRSTPRAPVPVVSSTAQRVPPPAKAGARRGTYATAPNARDNQNSNEPIRDDMRGMINTPPIDRPSDVPET
jgi:hypothetical protein